MAGGILPGPKHSPFTAKPSSHHVHVTPSWHAGSVSAESVGQEEVGGVTHRVTCTWWLLGLAVKGSWFGLAFSRFFSL